MNPANSLLFLTATGLLCASAVQAPDHTPVGTVIYFALLLAGLSLGSWALYRDRRHAR